MTDLVPPRAIVFITKAAINNITKSRTKLQARFNLV
jgi:hypothetical protein